MRDKEPASGAVLWSWMVRLGLPDPVLYLLTGHFNHTDPGQNGLLYEVLTTRGKLARERIRLEVARSRSGRWLNKTVAGIMPTETAVASISGQREKLTSSFRTLEGTVKEWPTDESPGKLALPSDQAVLRVGPFEWPG